MSMVKKHRRKPLEPSAGNYLVQKKKRPLHCKADRHPNKSLALTKPSQTQTKSKIESKQRRQEHASSSTRAVERKQPKRTKDANGSTKRRDSKTPKASNLSTAGGAYSLRHEELDELSRPLAKISKTSKTAPTHNRLTALTTAARPDPSPIKRPDPSAVSKKKKLPAKSAKHEATTTKRDNFVAASLKRLFQPSKSLTTANFHSIAKPTTTKDQPREPTDPSPNHASSDLDTACSTPEKDSPLIKSPLARPDPIAKDEGHRCGGGDNVKHDAMIGQIEQDASGTADKRMGSRISQGPGPSSRTHQLKATNHLAKEDTRDKPKVVSMEVLDKARTGPTDNKRVLDAMFKSGNDKSTHRTHGNGNEASVAFLIGSIVGGASLQRSNSADESEVTSMDYILEDTASHASMTTRAEHAAKTTKGGIAPHHTSKVNHANIDPHQAPSNNEPVPDIFRRRTHHNISSKSNATTSHHQELQRGHAIEAQTNTQRDTDQLQNHTHSSSTRLPAGWRMKWSKTKQRPYYVHPDFGSTWHCPGLAFDEHLVAARNELFDDQRLHIERPRYTVNEQRVSQVQHSGSAYHTAHFNQFDELGASMNNAQKDGCQKSGNDHGVNYGTTGLTHSATKNVSANHERYSTHKSNAKDDNFESNHNDYQAQNDIAEKLTPRVATESREKNASSADVSSKCLTQDFGSDDGVASASSTKYAKTSNDESRTMTKQAPGTTEEEDEHQSHYPVDYDSGLKDDLDELSEENHEHLHSNNAETELQSYSHGEDSVKFDTNDGGAFDESADDERSLDQIDGEALRKEKSVDDSEDKFTQGSNVDETSDLETFSDLKDEINSLASDHVDVECLLRGGKKKCQSPLSTINESCNESVGSKTSMNEASIIEERKGDIETSSYGENVDKSTIDPQSSKCEKDNDVDSHGSDGYDQQNTVFENNNDSGYDDFDDDLAAEAKSLDNSQPRRMSDGIVGLNLDTEFKKECSKEASHKKKCKKKIFPPGPLCSLQFLDEIENEEFDTPLWRRMKRKRSTLASVKRRGNDEKRRATYS